MIMEYAEQATAIIGAVTVAVSSLLTIFLAIPGDQPDKFLQKCLDILTKISRKKK